MVSISHLEILTSGESIAVSSLQLKETLNSWGSVWH